MIEVTRKKTRTHNENNIMSRGAIMANEARIKITENGPYEVSGSIPIRVQVSTIGPEGEPVEWVEGEAVEATASYRLCRCGRSSNKPFCDETHTGIPFD